MKLYQQIASNVDIIKRAEKAIAEGNDIERHQSWLDPAEERLKNLVDELPSGSGIDTGTKIVLDECTKDKLVFEFGFHHMNDGGMYDGWTEHKLVVTPCFSGINLKITGRDRNQIKEYLYDTYSYALSVEA